MTFSSRRCSLVWAECSFQILRKSGIVVTLVKNLLWGGGAGKWRPMGWIIDYFKPTQHQHMADHWGCAFYFNQRNRKIERMQIKFVEEGLKKSQPDEKIIAARLVYCPWLVGKDVSCSPTSPLGTLLSCSIDVEWTDMNWDKSGQKDENIERQ